MEKGGGKNKKSIVILVVLFVMIVGLAIGIVVVNINNNAREGQGQTELEAEEYFEAAVNNEVYVLTEELAKTYNGGDKEKAILGYKTNMSEALDGEDYDKFFRLLSSASVAMTDNEDCTRLMELYDGIDEDKLPPSRRVDFYGTAEGYCVSCGDNARQALYETKAQQLYDSGEVEDYEN